VLTTSEASNQIAPLEPTSASQNPLKRPLETTSGKTKEKENQPPPSKQRKRLQATSEQNKENAGQPEQPKKRTSLPLIFTAAEFRAWRAENPVIPWDETTITGHYNVTWGVNAETRRRFDTTRFGLKLYYRCTPGVPRQIYAMFHFDDLEGLWRLAPCDVWKGRPVTYSEFDEACNFEEKDWPGRGRSEVSMKWRGKERGEKLVRGLLLNLVEFQQDDSVSSTKFPAMKLHFDMMYDDEHFQLTATKIANLDFGGRDLPFSVEQLEQRWKDLYDLGWGDVDPLVEFDPPKNEQSMSTRKRLKPQRPSARLRSKLEYRPFNIEDQTQPKAVSAEPSAFLNEAAFEPMPEWAWNVSGRWEITPSHFTQILRADLDDLTPMFMNIKVANNPRHNKIGRQLWATFEFGHVMKGCMRFCPALPSDAAHDSVSEFEKACVLQGGAWPGAKPNGHKKWNMRWRGTDSNKGHSCLCDEYETQVTFKEGTDGGLSMEGVMIIECQPTVLKAVKIRELKSSEAGGSTVKNTWRLFMGRKPIGGYLIDYDDR
jgi:hypothetical protein